MIVILNLTNNDRGGVDDEVYRGLIYFNLNGMTLGRMDLSGEIPGNLSAPLFKASLDSFDH